MNVQHEVNGVGGWRVPCAPFDYRAFERTAEHERDVIKERLEALKKQRPKSAEAELLRRREVRMLTDMYYEQRSNAKMFAAIAQERKM